MSFQTTLENVNEGSVLVCFCLFWWVLLVGASADGLLNIPYWAMFLPLWLWKCIVFVGWFCGMVVWVRQRRSHANPEIALISSNDPAVPYIQAMSVSTFFTLLLACSEVLLCVRLSTGAQKPNYLTIFTPLILVGLLGIFGFIFVMIDTRSHLWTIRHRGERHRRSRSNGRDIQDPYDVSMQPSRPRLVCSFTLELCIGVNLLQLLFLIARLDKWIASEWIIIFIPTFILLGIMFFFCIVGFLVALIRYFTAFFLPIEQRRLPLYYYLSHIVIEFLLCTSVILLALRLDRRLSPSQMSYSLICAPVLLSLITYAINSCCLGPGNPWWFGLNQNIILLLFKSCPVLQLCANTSVNANGFWKTPDVSSPDATSDSSMRMNNSPSVDAADAPPLSFYSHSDNPLSGTITEHAEQTNGRQSTLSSPGRHSSSFIAVDVRRDSGEALALKVPVLSHELTTNVLRLQENVQFPD